MPKNKNTLIDASWWIGGNKNRGIGKYLEWYFLHELSLPTENRYLIFPKKLSKKEKDDFSNTFSGKILYLPIDSTNSSEDTQNLLASVIKQNSISNVLVGSPFERPWALTSQFHFIKAIKPEIDLSVIIHDLIPLLYKKEVLSAWPKEDQKEYLSNIQQMSYVDTILCTSPFSKKQVLDTLPAANTITSVIPFGTKTDWLTIPKNTKKVTSSKPLAVTISGGEWRKNLTGTLTYFAQNLKDTHDLVVICKLGKREKIKFKLLALRLGISTQTTFTGEIDEPKKWSYLQSCDTFLFLSHAEGLGIPLLEAKKAGVKRFVLSSELYSEEFGSMLDGCEVSHIKET